MDKILLGFKDAEERLPKAKELIVTGNPTKFTDKVLSWDQRAKLKHELDIDNSLPIVLVFGGSQGAKSINKTLINIIKNNLNSNYQLIWAVGQKQYEEIIEELVKGNINTENIENTKILPYIYNMEEIMRLADIIISRSGAMTITEIGVVGKPAIFIPFPFATENHQEYNAKVLENAGAARIILDKELNSEILTRTLNNMLENKEILAEMGENAKQINVPYTLDLIYNQIEELVNVEEAEIGSEQI